MHRSNVTGTRHPEFCIRTKKIRLPFKGYIFINENVKVKWERKFQSGKMTFQENHFSRIARKMLVP